MEHGYFTRLQFLWPRLLLKYLNWLITQGLASDLVFERKQLHILTRLKLLVNALLSYIALDSFHGSLVEDLSRLAFLKLSLIRCFDLVLWLVIGN